MDFLWTSVQLGSSASVIDHIKKYCFNAPGNWRIWNENTLSWVPSTLTPASSVLQGIVTVYVGASAHPTRGVGRTGWITPRHPLLFGGISGGIGGFTATNDWRFSAATGNASSAFLVNEIYYSVGTTFTHGGDENFPHTDFDIGYLNRPRKQLGLDVPNIDYPFPYFGGGITGEIAEWCAARDGLTVGAYETPYGGFHRPEDGLKLKVSTLASFEDLRIAGQLPGISYSGDPLQGKVKFVPAYVSPVGSVPQAANYGLTGISWGDPSGRIATNLSVQTFNGAGFEIDGGKFARVRVNYPQGVLNSIVTSESNIRVNFGAMSALRTYKYEDIVDYGVTLKNVSTSKLESISLQKLNVVGGDYGSMNLFPCGFGLSRLYSPGTAPPIFMFPNALSNGGITWNTPTTSGPSTYLRNGWNWTVPYAFTYGLTGDNLEVAIPSVCGVLTIDSTNKFFITNSIEWGFDDGSEIEPGNNNIQNYWIQYSGNTLPKWEYGTATERTREGTKVILGDPDDQGFTFGIGNPQWGSPSTTTSGLSKITLINSRVSTQDSYIFYNAMVPSVLQIASPGFARFVECFSGIIEPHPNISTSSLVNMEMLKLYRSSKVNLGDKNIKFGYFYNSGQSGAMSFPVGGIVSGDWTQNLVFSTNHAFWASGVQQNRLIRNNPDQIQIASIPGVVDVPDLN